jgi:hypothetical protein
MSEVSDTESRRRPQRFWHHRLLGVVEILGASYAATFCAFITSYFLMLIHDEHFDTTSTAWEVERLGVPILLPCFALLLHHLRRGGAIDLRRHVSRELPVDLVFLGRAVVLISLSQLLVDELWVYGEASGWWLDHLVRAPNAIVPSGAWFSFDSFLALAWFFLVFPCILRQEFGRVGALLIALVYGASQSFVFVHPFHPIGEVQFSAMRFVEVTWLSALAILITPRRSSPWTLLSVVLVVSCRVLIDSIPLEIWTLAALMVAVEFLVGETSSRRHARTCRWPRAGHWALFAGAALLVLASQKLMATELVWVPWIGFLAVYWMSAAYDARFGKTKPVKIVDGEG